MAAKPAGCFGPWTSTNGSAMATSASGTRNQVRFSASMYWMAR
jgi:hypothetical protein